MGAATNSTHTEVSVGVATNSIDTKVVHTNIVDVVLGHILKQGTLILAVGLATNSTPTKVTNPLLRVSGQLCPIGTASFIYLELVGREEILCKLVGKS